MDVANLHNRAVAEFGSRVENIGDEQWHAPTPCEDWDVRALVNHVTGEALWAPPLMNGATIEEVGDRFDGDVLGDDPKARWRAAADEARAIAEDAGLAYVEDLCIGVERSRYGITKHDTN